MAKLKFIEDADGKPTKEAVGMYSKDGEYVDFDEPCICVGQVHHKSEYKSGMQSLTNYYCFRLKPGWMLFWIGCVPLYATALLRP